MTLKTERTKVRRARERGAYDRESVHSILDEGMVCHVGFVSDGQPYVIPTAYARRGDEVLIHGSIISRMMRRLQEGVDACLTVTLLDGLVLARSTFHHSMNYRSVVILGRMYKVEGDQAKLDALDALVEHLVPGRSRDARLPSPKELAATDVLTLPIDEASAKVRSGPPDDPKGDMALDYWAGVVPLARGFGEPEPDPVLREGIALPDYLKPFRRPGQEE
ncbi:MAG: pyridoxamine 5'-phosphate oxidase family protein [Acidobacteriota bacterium]